MTTKDRDKKKLELTTEITFKNEQQVKVGNIEKLEHSKAINANLSSFNLSFDINGEEKSFKYDLIYNEKDNSPVSLYKLREVYSKSNNSLDETYNYLKKQILQNPENTELIIRDLGSALLDLYDNNMQHKDFGYTAKDMLDDILNCPEGETLDGFVCMGIHEFGMKLLHDCGIPAVILCGDSDNTHHATMLYQNSDGKFVYNNYFKSIIIDAPNLIDAIKTVYKQSGDLKSSGYIEILDENNSYQRFAFEQEALWANELDKTDYNKISPFSEIISSETTEIKGQQEISNLGNLRSTVTGNLFQGDSEKAKQTSLTLGYQKNNKTALFDVSNAVGIKVEHNGYNKKNDLFFKTKATLQNLQGAKFITEMEPEVLLETSVTEEPIRSSLEQCLKEAGVTNTSEYLNAFSDFSIVHLIGGRDAALQEENHLLGFFNGIVGKKTSVLDKGKIKLNNSAMASLNWGTTSQRNNMYTSDFRVTVEDGIELATGDTNWKLNSFLSGGYVGDFKITTGEQKLGIQSGAKINLGLSFMSKPTENIEVAANVEANTVNLKPYQDYGVSSSLYGGYKLSPQQSIYGQIDYSKAVQNLNLGGFSGKSFDKSLWGAKLGVQLKNTNLYLACNKLINKTNSTYNNSSITLGVKFGL